jgi:phenylacetate-CoA ligase
MRARHEAVRDPGAIAAWQTARFNVVWGQALARHRFYRRWRETHGLPDRLETIAQLADFPVLRRAEIQAHADEIFADAAPCSRVVTGGSTGQPAAFPSGRDVLDQTHANAYLCRSWWGIRPGDRIVLLWGHAHLFGRGALGRVNMWRRHVQDLAIGTTRLNGYKLAPEHLAAQARAIAARPGCVLIGFASGLRRLLDHIEDHGPPSSAFRVRGVIFCAELVEDDDFARARALLGAPAWAEYGSIEQGTIASSTPAGDGLHFLWQAFATHAAPDKELVVTSLQERRFPLVNYGTADLVEPLTPNFGGVFRCARILGRANDAVDVPLAGDRSAPAHSQLIAMVAKQPPGVRNYQVVDRGGTLTFRLALRPGAGTSLAEAGARIARELAREFPDLDAGRLRFEPLDAVERTVAGKQRFIVKER